MKEYLSPDKDLISLVVVFFVTYLFLTSIRTCSCTYNVRCGKQAGVPKVVRIKQAQASIGGKEHEQAQVGKRTYERKARKKERMMARKHKEESKR